MKIASNSCALLPTFNWNFWPNWATYVFEKLLFRDAQLLHTKKEVKKLGEGRKTYGATYKTPGSSYNLKIKKSVIFINVLT